MVGGLVADEPELAADVVFGAAALAKVEARFAHAVLRAWGDGTTSLRPSLEIALGVAPASDLVVVPTPKPVPVRRTPPNVGRSLPSAT